jgi:hypothetical protein
MTEAGRSARDLLRHAVATLAYRGGKAVRGAPEGFASFRAAPGSRSAAQILAHVGDLLDWAVSIARGAETWKNARPLPWEKEVARFHDALARFDAALAGAAALPVSEERLFQGPVADALTHVGQIAMLRRIAGVPIRGENYFRADVAAGRVGADQPPSNVEFD